MHGAHLLLSVDLPLLQLPLQQQALLLKARHNLFLGLYLLLLGIEQLGRLIELCFLLPRLVLRLPDVLLYVEQLPQEVVCFQRILQAMQGKSQSFLGPGTCPLRRNDAFKYSVHSGGDTSTMERVA